MFASLTGAQQAVVAGYARATRLGRGEQLYGPGDRVGRLFVVHTGRVKVLRVASNGGEALVRVAGPGDVVGELAFVTGERPDHRVVAMGEVSMCVFDHRDLAAILAAYPGVVMQMLQAVAHRLEAGEARLAAMSSIDVTGRLAEYLLGLPIAVDSLGARDGRTRVRLPMAKKDLAAYLGTTPESVSRALRRMTDSGMITAGRGPVLVINDPDALESLAQPA
jgi:CRP/FNR family transcriptional regulator